MQAVDIERDLTFEQMGWVLCGSTNELRALVLGEVAFQGGQLAYQKAHTELTNLGYNRQYSFKPKNNVLATIQNTPDLLAQVDGDDISISPELGHHAVAFSGVLFCELPDRPSSSFRNVVGLYKQTGKEIEIPGTSLRRAVISQAVSSKPSKGIKRATLINRAAEVNGCDSGLIRKHVENLIKIGIFVFDEKDTTIEVNPDIIETLKQYTELATTFETDLQLRKFGYQYIAELLSGQGPDSHKIPYFARRSVTGSGRTKAPVLEKFVSMLPGIFINGERLLTTEVAFRTGYDIHVVYDLLQRMEKTIPNAPVRRTNEPDSGKIRVREREWGLVAA